MAWLGGKDGMVVDAGDLRLEAGAQEGTYLLQDGGGGNAFVDTGTVGRYRIHCQFDAKESGGVTGDDSNEIEVKLEIDLATAAGPAWTGWEPYLPGEYTCRWYRIRATVRVEDAFQNRPRLLRFEHSNTPIGSVPMAASVDDLVNVPTGAEAHGTRYIVIAVGAGDFTLKEDQIAELIETTVRTWEFAIPVDRQEVYDLASGWKYRYEGNFPAGSWVPRGLDVTNPEEDKFVGAETVVGAKNKLWDTDGGGDIGQVGANRPDNVHAKTGMTINGVSVVAGPHTVGQVPIGGIVAWHKTFPNTPALPAQFVECNGQTLSDGASPYDGQVIPDLNGDARFLRGAAASGTNQAEGTKIPAVPFTSGGRSADHTHFTVNSNDMTKRDGVAHSNQPPANWFGDAGGSPTTSGSSVDHTHTITGGGDAETRPINMSVVWIMRIK